MKCDQIKSLLDDLPIAEFTAEQLAEAAQHAESCSTCRELLATEKNLDRQLRSLPEPDQPVDLVDSVMARIKQEQVSKPVTKQATPPLEKSDWPLLVMISGAALIFCLYTYELLHGRSTAFNLYSPWTGEWTQWLYVPLQIDQFGLMVAAGFAIYLAGFLVLDRNRDLSTSETK